MNRVRALTKRLAPVLGETFASYIDRLAAQHKVTRLVMLKWVGLLEEEHYKPLTGFGILLDNVTLERFCTATGLTSIDVTKMLLTSYDGIAFDLSAAARSNTLHNRAASGWAYFYGSHACPHCLKEDHGAWQLVWKFPWTFTCVKHECYLVSHCPACGLRLAQGRANRKRVLSPSWVHRVPQPGHCINPRPDNGNKLLGSYDLASTGNRLPCGHDLTTLPTVESSIAALRLQNTLHEYLGGRAAVILGNQVSSLSYFRNLGALCTLILHTGELDDFDNLSPTEGVAIKTFTNERNSIANVLKDSPSRLQRENISRRLLNQHQESPGLMAAITRFAAAILTADAKSMAVLLRPLTKRLFASAESPWQFLDTLEFEDQVTEVIYESVEPIINFDRAVGRTSIAKRDTKFAFGPRHVPPLLWANEFEEHFATFFPRTTTVARRFCSMALVKLCGNYSWAQSAILLGLAAADGDNTAGRYINLLRHSDERNRFVEALHELAGRLSDDPDKIDYLARRKALWSLIDIPTERWCEMCRSAGISPGRPGGFSKYAAVWLWAELTESDWRLAPALAEKNTPKTANKVYFQYRKLFAKVGLHLREYGYQLLGNEKRLS